MAEENSNKSGKVVTHKNLLYAIGQFLGDKFTKAGVGAGGGGKFPKSFDITNPVGMAKGSVAKDELVTNVVEQMLTSKMNVTASLITNANSENERGKVVEVNKLICSLSIPSGCSVQKVIFYDHDNTPLNGYITESKDGNDTRKDIPDGNVSYGDGITSNHNQTIYPVKPFVFGKTTADSSGNKKHITDTNFDETYSYRATVYWTDNLGVSTTTDVYASISWPLNTYFYGYIYGDATYVDTQDVRKLLSEQIDENWLFKQWANQSDSKSANGKLTKVTAAPQQKLSNVHRYTIPAPKDGYCAWMVAIYPERWMRNGYQNANGQPTQPMIETPVCIQAGVPYEQNSANTELQNVRKWRDASDMDSDEISYQEDYCVIVYGYKGGQAGRVDIETIIA